MQKVIESNGKFYVKLYNENGDSIAISKPFDTEAEATEALEASGEEKPKKGKKAEKEVELEDEI